jgi:uncharacterized protein YjbI with pentapeptide repeats
MSYVDKTMFYQSQFINCNTPFSMIATRANKRLGRCKFDGGGIALTLAAKSTSMVARCDFTNYTGTNVIRTNSISVYSIFYNSITSSTIRSVGTNIEGCNFRFKQYV